MLQVHAEVLYSVKSYHIYYLEILKYMVHVTAFRPSAGSICLVTRDGGHVLFFLFLVNGAR